MPVHDKQMPESGLVWTKVAPGKWREAAEVAIVQHPKRARTLPFNDKTAADFKNWLDFLEHMNHDAYITLMRYLVGTGVIEHHDWAAAGNLKPYKYKSTCTFYLPGYPYCRLDRDINIYGLQYSTEEISDFDEDSYEHITRFCINWGHKKNNLLAAAEANGIKVFKSWSKPRIWKALLSA